MNDDFVKNALTYGAAGRAWLDQLPSKIEAYESKWSFKALPPYDLSFNYVVPVIRHDNTKAVLKIGMIQDKEFQTEIEAMVLYNGQGCPKLIEADKENAVILIEQISPGIPLSTLEDDDEATRILARMMKKLWKPLPQNHHFTTIKEWTKALSEYPKKYKNNHPIPLNLVNKAINLFAELIDTSSSAVLVHGDLHHGNVLSSNRDEWLAIDPKGIAAEPAYEVAALIRNPYKKISAMENIGPLLKKRIEILSEELNVNPKRIYKWCLTQTILSGVWTSDISQYTNHALKVIQALEKIKF